MLESLKYSSEYIYFQYSCRNKENKIMIIINYLWNFTIQPLIRKRKIPNNHNAPFPNKSVITNSMSRQLL